MQMQNAKTNSGPGDARARGGGVQDMSVEGRGQRSRARGARDKKSGLVA